jgi:uncharacterized membrane protein
MKTPKRKIALTPQIEAEIAIKAMLTGNLKEIAENYGTSEYFVYLLQKTLMENAGDLFLLISGDESILKALVTVRDQIDGIQESLDEIIAFFSANKKKYGLTNHSRRHDGLLDI